MSQSNAFYDNPLRLENPQSFHSATEVLNFELTARSSENVTLCMVAVPAVALVVALVVVVAGAGCIAIVSLGAASLLFIMAL